MAKKRVHEIAKERGISSKEVLAVLQRAGLDVKAAASSVDEQDIARAFAPGSDSNGADAATAEPAAPEDGDRAPGPKPPPQQARSGEERPRGAQPKRPGRPTRAVPPRDGGGGGGPRRRAGIASQASRRPPGPPPPPPPPGRGRGPRP